MKIFVILAALTSVVLAQDYPNVGVVVTAANSPHESYILANFTQFVNSTNYNATYPTILYSYVTYKSTNSKILIAFFIKTAMDTLKR